MDKSQPSSSRGAEGLPVGKKATPITTDKAKKDALKALQQKYKKVKEEVEEQGLAEGSNPIHPELHKKLTASGYTHVENNKYIHPQYGKVKVQPTGVKSGRANNGLRPEGVRIHGPRIDSYINDWTLKSTRFSESAGEEQGVAEGKYNFSSGSYSKRREMGYELGHEDRPGFDPTKYAKMLQKRIDARGGTRGPVGTPEYHKITPFEKPKNEENENFTDNTFKENNMRNNKKTVVEFVIENIIEIEIPDNLTYQDYIDAIQTIVDTDDEDAQTDILTIANEAFKNKEISVIAEAELIRKGILETYKATKSGEKEYSPELNLDVDRSKPGVTKVSRRIEAGVGQGTTATERRTMKRIASRNK